MRTMFNCPNSTDIPRFNHSNLSNYMNQNIILTGKDFLLHCKVPIKAYNVMHKHDIAVNMVIKVKDH